MGDCEIKPNAGEVNGTRYQAASLVHSVFLTYLERQVPYVLELDQALSCWEISKSG